MTDVRFGTARTDPAPSGLLPTIEDALRDNSRALWILDRNTNVWQAHEWRAIYQLGGRIAADFLRGTGESDRSPVGIVGEPSAELAGVVLASWMAGRPVAIQPGSVRGASAERWAGATLDRWHGMGVRTAFAGGAQLEQLRASGGAVAVLDIGSVAALPAGTVRPVEVAEERAAVLQGTAGSTGVPKAAVQSRRAVVHHFRAVADRLRLDPADDVLCSWLPLYHDLGLLILVLGMCSGCSVWLTSPGAFARSPLTWIDWLSQSRATMMPAPNFAYDLIGRYAKRVDGADLSAVRLALNGGEQVDCDAMERFGAEMGRFGFDSTALTPAYGLAEATCGLTLPEPGRGLRFDRTQPAPESVSTRYALLGKPLDGVQLRIVDDATATSEQRRAGEIQFRGPTTMSGYLGDQRAVSPTDWCPTGDIGYLVDGELVVCGRLKEMLTFAGRNLFPQQIEEVAARVPGIDKGAVVATTVRRGAESGNQRQALVIVAEYRGHSEHGVITDQICELVAAECGVVPNTVELVARGKLPRTTSGKLRRLAVGSWFAAN